MKTIIFILFLSFSFSASAQYVEGTARSESGFAASLINVQFKNKKNEITTNADGTFKIFATRLPDTLMFSGPGIEPYEVIITEENIADPKFEVVLLDERSDRPAMGEPMIAIDPETYEERIIFPGAAAEPVTIRKKRFVVAETLKPDETVSAKSKLITSGEVNDFLKWNLWEDYTEVEFESASNLYGIFPENRFCVQLKNENNKAVVGMPISLINEKTNAVIWEAISDNTGKAELWNQFFSKEDEGIDLAILCDGEKLEKPIPFSEGMNEMSLAKNCEVSDLVEIAFMMDATSSMSSEMEFLKLDLEAVIRQTFTKLDDLDLRVGTVFYRDIGDKFVTSKLDFQTDLLKVLNFIKLQKAAGGGDTPEAVHSALDDVVNGLNWSENARTKMLFIISDAPPHNYAFAEMRTLTHAAAKKGIRIIPIACKNVDNNYEFLLRSMSLATNGTYFCLTNHSGIGGSHKEPITDEYEVELLNNAMQRIIQQFVFVEDCESEESEEKVMEQISLRHKDILDFKVYPNPTAGKISIVIKEKIQGLYLSDFTGKLLQELSVEEGKQKLNLEQYPSGIYLLRYLTEDNKWGAKKIILQRD